VPEWSRVRQTAAKKGIGFEALDNGVLGCDDPKRLQTICDGLSGDKIDALLRKWLRKLPHPFPAGDRKAGYRYQISILQAEFSLTQVLDRPVTGRVFFEEVIRENLDIGRPGHAADQLACVPRYRGTAPAPLSSPDLPCPEHPECATVPCDDGFRPYDDQRGSPL
jgi:hypothetical protein